MRNAIALILLTLSCGPAGCATRHAGAPLEAGVVQMDRDAEAYAKRPAEDVRWFYVSEDPPILFPAGISPDHPTDYEHGQWVEGGPAGARFFIPHDGSPDRTSDELLRDALDQRTAGTKAAVVTGMAIDIAGEAVTRFIVGMAYAMAGAM